MRTVTKSDVKERKNMGWGESDTLTILLCEHCGFFLLHGLALSFSWPAATAGSSITCNHCYFEAKDESLLSSLRLLMRKPEF